MNDVDDREIASSHPDTSEVGDLVRGAARGDRDAWEALVERYAPMVWRLACWMCRSSADGADVSQTVWMRLLESIDTLQQPERVGAWLVTTTRRECLRVMDRASRTRLTDNDTDLDRLDHRSSLDARLLTDERDHVLWEAFATLPDSGQRLLTLLMVDPPMSYQDIAAALDMPIGSIGPTRARLLDKLRVRAERLGLSSDDAHIPVLDRPA